MSRVASVEEVRSVVLGRLKPVLLLGAGASATSGVPLVVRLIDMMGKQGYCWNHGREFTDDTVMRSDWLPWVQAQSWFDTDLEVADLYGRHIEELLQPRARRREFFQQHVLVDPRQASSGYRELAELVGKRRIHTILTTNFDTLAYDSCKSNFSAATVVQVQSPDQAHLISTDPPVSQVVHVHGAVDHYTDLNLTTEVSSVDQRYAKPAVSLIKDHPLIVVGYRGAEPSVSRDLLLAAASVDPTALPNGIYWCHRPGDGDLHPLVEELAEACGRNFAKVEIAGFDEFMQALNAGMPRLESSETSRAPAFDSKAVVGNAEGVKLDDRRVSAILDTAAFERLSLPVGDWLDDPIERLRAFGLSSVTGGEIKITNAARLLFAADPVIRVVGHANGNPFDFEGNIFDAYEQLSRIVTEVNQPYRLKGPESVDVRPYPPLALKELIVNALGHRDYESDQPIELVVSEGRLTITSPGGLLDPAIVDDLGKVDVHEYRNPRIAEVLYSAGLMDKLGSGLIDVRRWVEAGGAEVTFDVGDDNDAFVVEISSRPDSGESDVAAESNYEIFYLNALRVGLPEHVWVGHTTARNVKQIFESHRGESVPPFVLDGHLLVSLSDLSDSANPLSQNVEAAEAHENQDFCSDPARERKIVELLNRSFQRHMTSDDTQVWAKRRRAWFKAPDDGSDFQITYRARTRNAQ